MDRKDNDGLGRRSIITGLGVAAAGLVASSGSQAQSGRRASRSTFEPARHAIDSWFDALPGNHRVFVDSASANGGAEAVGYSGNLFRATAAAYADEPADLAIVVCFRHMSTPFGYTDAMWDKYGEVFDSMMDFKDPSTHQAPKINLMNSAEQQSLGNRGTTIDSLVERGVNFAICNMASQAFAGFVANQTQQKMDDVLAEFHAHAIPNGRFVSAGVMALTRAQEYGYSVLISG